MDKPLRVPPNIKLGDQTVLSTNSGHHHLETVVAKLESENVVRYFHTGLATLDFYEVLTGGGLWVGQPGLGLLYHGIPLAFIAVQAGGKVVPNILEIPPHNIHQKVPIAVLSAVDTNYNELK